MEGKEQKESPAKKDETEEEKIPHSSTFGGVGGDDKDAQSTATFPQAYAHQASSVASEYPS